MKDKWIRDADHKVVMDNQGTKRQAMEKIRQMKQELARSRSLEEIEACESTVYRYQADSRRKSQPMGSQQVAIDRMYEITDRWVDDGTCDRKNGYQMVCRFRDVIREVLEQRAWDDDEPVTVEWYESLGFKPTGKNREWSYRFQDFQGDPADLIFTNDGTLMICCPHEPWVELDAETRGAARRIFAVCGIELN